MAELDFEASAEDDGERLDVVLVRRVPGMSRDRARQWAARGWVRVNGRRAVKAHHLREGDRVSLQELPPEKEFSARPDPAVPLEIVLETKTIVVVEKPPGVPSHPLSAEETGTVANGLVARYPEMKGVGYAPSEPGIVHRIDTDTSGLMLAARSAESFDQLRELLRAGRIDKRYLALCTGAVEAPQTVDLPVINPPGSRRRVHVGTQSGSSRSSVTEVLSSEPVGAFSFIEVQASTAQRHQVRAHLASIGHPLAGDRLYGGPDIPGLDRHFLHASRVKYDAHGILEAIDVTSPPASDLEAVLESLRG